MDADSITELIKNKNISEEGLEQMARKKQLQMDCAKAYPDMDKTMLEWIIDWYLNHPDEAEAYMRKDKKFMRNIVEE